MWNFRSQRRLFHVQLSRSYERPPGRSRLPCLNLEFRNSDFSPLSFSQPLWRALLSQVQEEAAVAAMEVVAEAVEGRMPEAAATVVAVTSAVVLAVAAERISAARAAVAGGRRSRGLRHGRVSAPNARRHARLRPTAIRARPPGRRQTPIEAPLSAPEMRP